MTTTLRLDRVAKSFTLRLRGGLTIDAVPVAESSRRFSATSARRSFRDHQRGSS